MSMKYFLSDQPTLSRFHLHPLGRYLDSYAAYLHDQGYDRNTARVKIRTIARFSPWLKRHGIAAMDLNSGHIQDYLSMKVRKGPRLTKEDGAALRQFAEFLHAQRVIAERIVPPVERTAIQQMVDEYALYLRNERALASGTIAQYESRVSQFLDARFAHGVVDLSTLRATDVIAFAFELSQSPHTQFFPELVGRYVSLQKSLKRKTDVGTPYLSLKRSASGLLICRNSVAWHFCRNDKAWRELFTTLRRI